MHEHVRIDPITIASAVLPAPGASHTFGWSVTLPLSAGGAGISVHFTLLGFQYGYGEAVLASVGTPEPVAATVQRRLFSLLLERAKESRL